MNGPGKVRRTASHPGLSGRHRAGKGRGGWRPRWLVLHAGVYLVVNGFLTVTWLLAPRVDEQFWPAWIMLLFAVPLGLHAIAVVATWPPRAPADSTGSREATTDGKVVEHGPGGLEVTSLRQRLRRLPAPVIDAGLAMALAVAITIQIRVAPGPGARPDVFAYACGWTIAALALARRRWPLAVLLASSAALQIYYLSLYTSTYPAVPLSVALATAWAAGHRRWSLLIAAWYVIGPLADALSHLSEETTTPLTLLGNAVSNAAMFAAVLVLGEAVRSRRALQLEQQRSERLLLNVLPAPIAERLKAGEAVIADTYPEVTVLFADIVDFTRRSQRTRPAQVVGALNELFSAFDELAQRHGLEKIKTIGDAYMAAGGLPTPKPDHAEAVAELALAMQAEVARHTDPSGQPLAVRIGIDTGPVEAGVIGTAKFSYDLWGDTVNTASRMESHGIAGCIQVTERTYQRLRDGYLFQRRGPIPVKGMGEMVTYLLVGRNQ